LPRPGLARPTAIYAAGANDNGEGQRTRQTATPLADKLGIPVNTSFGKGDEEALVEHVIAQPGPTLISWQHGEIPTIADAFPAVTPTPPAEWPDERFDVVWTFTKTADGWQFAQIPELVLPQDEASVIKDCVGRCRPPGDSAPASPESLYDRTGVLVEVLDRLRQVAFTLGNHAERAVSEAAATGYVLETDDGTPAGDYTYEGRRLLADVAAGIEKATHIATEAHGALSHLKLA
jgi:hypothetical protein